MKLYKETVKYDVWLPCYVIEVVDSEAKRTGIQRAVFLRSVILRWIKKQKGSTAGAEVGATTPRRDLEHKSKKTFSIQQMPNGRTWVFRIFICAGESVVLIEIARAEENPTTGRRWYDRIIGYVIRNWESLLFVLNIFFEMLMQV